MTAIYGVNLLAQRTDQREWSQSALQKGNRAVCVNATMKLMLAATLVGVTIAPALACIQTPVQIWAQIDAALPKAELSDADLAKVNELRAKAFSAVANPKVAEKYQEAVLATDEAIKIVGLVPVQPQGVPLLRGCGTTYRLKKEVDAR